VIVTKKEDSENISDNKQKIPSKLDKKACTCICSCFGFFQDKNWGFDYNTLPKFAEGSIKILYRDRVRVFYSNVESAHRDGYKDFDQSCYSEKNGYLYSFTGLRGDAKKLYKDVKNSKEKRVSLIRASTV
jgi:hypothetical protein